MVAVRQTSFAAGELDPKLHGRTDLAVFGKGARRLRNFFVTREGAAMSRPGTVFLGETKGAGTTKAVRLIPFVVSRDESYVCEFGHNYVRFWRNGEPVLFSATLVELTTPWGEDDLPFLQYAQTGDVLTITSPNEVPVELRRLGPAEFEFPSPDASAIQPRPPASDFWDILAPGLTFYEPRVSGVSPVNAGTAERPAREWIWKWTAVVQEVATGNYFETLPVTVTNSYEPGSPGTSVGLLPTIAVYPDMAVTIDLAQSGTGSVPALASTHRVVSLNVYRGRGTVFGLVGQTTTRSFVDVGEEPNYTIPPPEGTDPLKVYRADTPALVRTEEAFAVAFFQERRAFGGTAERPGRLWLSATGDYANFDRPVIPNADMSLEFEMATRRRETIRSMAGAETLFIFTDSSVWALDGGQGPLAFDSYDLRVVESGGACHLPALNVRSLLAYVTADERAVRLLAPSARVQRRYEGSPLTGHADHLFRGLAGTVVDWTYAEAPYGLVWAVRADGVLLSMTLGENNAAWTRHDTDGEAQSVCAIPEGNEDGVYLVVKRTIDGVVKRYVERMVDREPEGAEPMCLDCARSLTWDGDQWANVVLGADLTYLEGETVYVVGHGRAVEGPFVITDGQVPTVTGVEVGTNIYVGLLFTPEAELLDLAQAEVRTKPKVVSAVSFEVVASKGLHVGPDFEHLTEWRQRQVSDGYGPISAATELVTVAIRGGWNNNGRAALRQTMPLPVTLVGITREVEVGDR